MPKRDDSVKRVLKAFQERRGNHEKWCQEIELNRKAYLAILDADSDAARWTSKLTPPYVMQVVDTVVANLVDDRTRFMVRPRPRMASPEEIERHVRGARAHEILLGFQLDKDRFTEKLAAFTLQNAIAGLTVGKVFWRSEERPVRTLERQPVPVLDGTGQPAFDPFGQPLVREELAEVERTVMVSDDPTFEVVRVEDFLWEEAATELQRSPWLIHRCAYTYDELARLELAGVYENTRLLRDEKHGGFNDEFSTLEEQLSGDRRFRDRCEVLEFWCREPDGAVRCITVGDRKVLLRDERELFWHGEFPFVACSTRPDLFRIPGRSIVGAIRDLQTALWDTGNQRRDNLRLINNAVFAFRDDLIDRDALEWFPGAMWPVPGDVEQAIKMFAPDPTVTQVSLSEEALLKGDLQNVTGGMPFMSGTQSSTVDQQTATGVSIVTSLAQRMVAAQKQHLSWAVEKIGHQWVSLNQQNVREQRLVPVVGLDGAVAFEEIEPEMLQGSYHVNVQAATESMMRQERRAEAQALLQVGLAAMPVMAAVGSPLNARAFVEDYLRAFEIDDIDRYFAAAPQPQMAGGPPGAQPAGNGGGPAGPPPPGGPAPDQSGVPQFLQQMMAVGAGGVSNGG